MCDFHSTLCSRYARWAVSATADGTSELDAKTAALEQRMRILYPTRKPRGLWAKIILRCRAHYDPRIITT